MSGSITINRVEYMLDATEDSSEILRKFTKFFNQHKGKIFFFLEGDDDINFYLHIFDRYFPSPYQSWKDFVCHGRDNVLTLIQDLKEHTRLEYRECIHYGFIDKDYHEVEDNPDKDKIYITPCYSIENFYITDHFFKNVLERKFFLNMDDPTNNDYQKCWDNFIERRDEFVKKILKLDTYLRCNRIMYEDKKIPSKINARDINLNKSLTINLDSISSTATALEILNKTESDFDPSSLSIAKDFYINKSSNELAFFIRGKFIFHFIHNYLCKLKNANRNKNILYFEDSVKNNNLPSPHKIKYRRCTLQMSLDDEDLLSDLAKFTKTPECLENFLSKIIKDLEVAA